MRYYIQDGSETYLKVDLQEAYRIGVNLWEFKFFSEGSDKLTTVCIAKKCQKYFQKINNGRWTILALPFSLEKISNGKKVFNAHRGYLPSGLSGNDDGNLVTQMPGKVAKIIVKEGERVDKGQTLIIIEAMKMENELKASSNGIVKAIHVKDGQTLAQGVLMLELEGNEE